MTQSDILPPQKTRFDDTSDVSTISHFRDRQIWMPRLVFDALAAGQALIENKTFTDCVLTGPAVLLALGGVRFDACDMGTSDGDVRNLLLRPVGTQKVIGPVGFKDCLFQRCRFWAVGFTGSPQFIDSFVEALGSPDGASQ